MLEPASTHTISSCDSLEPQPKGNPRLQRPDCGLQHIMNLENNRAHIFQNLPTNAAMQRQKARRAFIHLQVAFELYGAAATRVEYWILLSLGGCCSSGDGNHPASCGCASGFGLIQCRVKNCVLPTPEIGSILSNSPIFVVSFLLTCAVLDG